MIVKAITCLSLITIFSCNITNKAYQHNERLFEMIYKSQKKYYNDKIVNKEDFRPIINFAYRGRKNLYTKHNFFFNEADNYILLEGFVNSNGRYVGIIFYDSVAAFYNNYENTGWQFLRLDKINEDSLVHASGINKNIIRRVRNWDTSYINELKHKVGNVVIDGFSFVASKVYSANKPDPVIETIEFYEFN
jgi:hypothetical protein